MDYFNSYCYFAIEILNRKLPKTSTMNTKPNLDLYIPAESLEGYISVLKGLSKYCSSEINAKEAYEECIWRAERLIMQAKENQEREKK